MGNSHILEPEDEMPFSNRQPRRLGRPSGISNRTMLSRQPAPSAPRVAPKQPPVPRAPWIAPSAPRGRPPGATARTRDLREACIEAAATYGRDGQGENELVGYLTKLADEEPRAFAALLGRLMPLQVQSTTPEGNVYVGKVVIAAVPQDRYLSADEVRAALGPPARPAVTIDAIEFSRVADDAG